MSTTTSSDAGVDVDTIREVMAQYAPSTGPERYARFIEDLLSLQRTYVQDHILATLHEHEQVVVSAANGVGKSYIAAAGGIAALHCNPDTIVNVTAGTSGTLKTNIWKPARSLYRDSPLPEMFGGRTMDGDREIRTGLDDEWFFECVSPRYPDDLQGPHNDHVIYIIEEADKPGVTDDHIEAVRSTGTDADDRILVISNPPDDSGNVVHRLIENDEWHHLQFPTWDCHNVRLARGLEDGDEIGGLATVHKLRKDWREYHDEEWPGLEQAIRWSDPWLGAAPEERSAVLPDDRTQLPNDDFREDLHSLWYRRRCGIVPPGGASTFRPYDAGTAKSAYQPSIETQRAKPVGSGIDVARASDRTILVTLWTNGALTVRYKATSTDYPTQETELMADRRLGNDPTHPVAVDAVGEGSGLADYLDDRLPNLHRFGSDKKPLTDGTDDDNPFGLINYKSQRAEGLAALGDALDSALAYQSSDLREELVTGARTIQFDTQTLDSRGEHGAEVVTVNSKDEVTERLGHSPDLLDAALMAVWARDCTPSSGVLAFQL
ncbi:hypothetical protein HZS55_09210 [Halosimplex rubrum]|uniref:Terminase n=1 Tax=Halosimplex rubrum TaxID=869889 RepID=A0A7D5NZM4_9EURY|nr:hypothetical protein [Halosimplex rubrum]QLH77463.1 hypothetical protein HZS55_09210 [Halosimplex rubrum]